MAGNEFCPVDADTLMYDWDYKQFVKLEMYVDFSDDRKLWAERDAKRVSNTQSPR